MCFSYSAKTIRYVFHSLLQLLNVLTLLQLLNKPFQLCCKSWTRLSQCPVITYLQAFSLLLNTFFKALNAFVNFSIITKFNAFYSYCYNFGELFSNSDTMTMAFSRSSTIIIYTLFVIRNPFVRNERRKRSKYKETAGCN